MKANIARIRKKRVPVYAGRGGGLPPMEHPPQRQGSAPPIGGSNEQNALDQISRSIEHQELLLQNSNEARLIKQFCIKAGYIRVLLPGDVLPFGRESSKTVWILESTMH